MFFGTYIMGKNISPSPEYALIWESIFPPDQNLDQLLARSQWDWETSSSYDIIFVGDEN